MDLLGYGLFALGLADGGGWWLADASRRAAADCGGGGCINGGSPVGGMGFAALTPRGPPHRTVMIDTGLAILCFLIAALPAFGAGH